MNPQVFEVAEMLINFKILKPKNRNECLHIAAAVVSDCDVIVSWNFKHIVNHKTIRGVKAITAFSGFRDIQIFTPSFLVGGEN
jgi:hypothetical protein